MLISELLEVVGASLRTGTDLPLSLSVTNRFVRDFRQFSRAFSPLGQEFLSFLDTKRENIDQPHGKKDSQWGGGQITGISGWWHCHLHFGKAVLIYKPVGRNLVLAAVVDHLSVEGTGRKIQALGDYLKKVDWNPQAKEISRQTRTTAITSVSDQQLVSDLGVDTQQDQPTTDTENTGSRINQLFYAMAAEPADRQVLADFSQGKSQEIFFFFSVMEPPIPEHIVDKTTLIKIAKSALAATAAR
tara:strand:- start:9166 stop:9897 length:732 start_codon:yes stop_codon:yes gene_type:complete